MPSKRVTSKGDEPVEKGDLSFSPKQKKQFTSAFEPVVEFHTPISGNYNGPFALISSGVAKKDVIAFLEAEGLTPIITEVKGSPPKVSISAEDYYTLEAKYIPLIPAKDLGAVIAKLKMPDHTADFENSASLFANSFARVAQLLRTSDIPFTYRITGHRVLMGEAGALHKGIITLSDEAYAALQTLHAGAATAAKSATVKTPAADYASERTGEKNFVKPARS